MVSSVSQADMRIGVSYLGYGLSRSFVAATAWQVLGGSMSSNVALTRCVVAELNPEKRFVDLSSSSRLHHPEPRVDTEQGLFFCFHCLQTLGIFSVRL
jgi:hypothetical protein